ncbi:O-antigen ligase family protein [Breznakibacter xylanolyticus]|nr:O-antigen ligase family protein [Breznakibacter xylanolyticus]
MTIILESSKNALANELLRWLSWLITAALLASAVVVRPDLFAGIITGKQWALEVATPGALACCLLFITTDRRISLTLTDVAVGMLALWVTASDGLLHPGHYQPMGDTIFNVSLWLLIYLFMRLASWQRHFTTAAIGLWLAVALIISAWGLLQLYGLAPSQHALFRITGPFHNPGPFSGYVVAALPLALAVIIGTKTLVPPKHACRSITILKHHFLLPTTAEGVGRILLKYISIGVVIALLLVIPAARSRAAWLAAITGALFVAWVHPRTQRTRWMIWSIFKQWPMAVRTLVIMGGLVLLMSVGWGMYALKSGSADGRWLMWQVTGTLIAQSPVVGHGAGAFDALYMNAQADWFQSGNGTAAQVLVAGSPEAPFNELLKLWLQYGAVAIALTLGIMWAVMTSKPVETPQARFLVRRSLMNRGLKGALLSLLVFGLFSYPFDMAPHMLLLVMATAMLAGNRRPVMTLSHHRATNVVITGTIATVIAMAVAYMPQRMAHYAALKKWQEATQCYDMRRYDDAVELYASALHPLSNNGLFLQMYGKALNMAGNYTHSNDILAIANKNHNSYIIHNTMGDNHKALGNTAEAARAYQNAAAMVPGMMFPKYLLAVLYRDTGQTVKAVETANQVLTMPVKVQSMATDEIISEMKKIISSYKQ